jgi:hypothetical protein
MPDEISVAFFISISDNLPILRLVTKPYSILIVKDNGYDITTNEIIRKLQTNPNKKERILQFQKYLIENNYINNASY